MSIKRLSGSLGLALLLTGTAVAESATKVTMKGKQGSIEEIVIGREMARVGTGTAGNYLLIELRGPRIYHVDGAQRVIMEMNRDTMPKPARATASKGRLEKQGAGPKIAGFATDHYQLSAGDTRCGDIFISPKAFGISGIKPVYRATREMAQQAKAMQSGVGHGRADPCDDADDLLVEELDRYGMLMRSLDRNGRVETEVVAIEPGVDAPTGSFQLPAGYQRVDMNQQLRKSQQMMRQMPDMQKIRELGQLPPEAREQAIRQMQEQIRAMQRQ